MGTPSGRAIIFEAYAIGVTLKLNNLVTPQLLAISGEVTKLDGLFMGLLKTIKMAGTEAPAFKALASGINASNHALEKASVSAAAFQRNMAAAIATASAAASLPAITMAGRGGGGGGAGRGGGGGGGGGGGSYAHGGNIHFGPAGIGLGAIGMRAGSAFVPLAVGAASIYAMHSVYEPAKHLDTERARFRLYGLGEKRNQDAFDFVDSYKAYGVSRNEKMKLFREAQGVFRESGASGDEALKSAKMAMPGMTALSLLMATMTDEGKSGASRNMLNALRFSEMSGGNASQAEFNKFLDVGFKMTQSSGGQINFSGLRQFKARAMTAGFNISPEGLAALEPLMAELTGSTAGTGLRVASNRLNGVVRIPNQAAHAMVGMGLWNKDSVQFNANGGIKTMGMKSPLSSENSKLFDVDPAAFYTTVLRPMYEKMKMDAGAIRHMNTLIYGGGTGGGLFNLIEKQLTVVQKSREALQVQVGMFSGADMVKKTITGQQEEFTSAWEDFKTSAGTTLLPFFSGLLKGGSAVLKSGMLDGGGDGRFVNVARTASNLMGWGANKVSDVFGTGGKGDSKFVAGGPGAGRGTTPAHVYMDGRLVGEITEGHRARAANKPQTGGGSFDGRMALSPSGGASGTW